MTKALSFAGTIRSDHSDHSDRGGAMSGVVVAVLILAAVAAAAFFYFGGEADVDIKKPKVTVTSDETPE